MQLWDQPPKNNKTLKVDINKIFAYSAKKNKANPILLYSTLYPATNSPSASGKSKGALFNSAKLATKKIKKKGKNGTINQVFSCKSTISYKCKLPAHILIVKKMIPTANSYEIICAVERKAPKKAYRELLLHPAIIIP